MGVRVEAHAVTFHRHGEPVFAPLDFALEIGSAVLIVGANGSGKTTLLRLMAGIISPHEGRLERAGRAAFLGHLPAIKADLTCRENLAYEHRLGPAGMAIEPALARVGLAGLGLRPARTLSAGQKKRLGLARLLVRRADIWLLDEPYASLDDAGGRLVDELLAGQLESGGCIALSTHQRMPALSFSPQIVDLSESPSAVLKSA